MEALQIHTRAENGRVTFDIPAEHAALANAQFLVLLVPEAQISQHEPQAQTERQARIDRLTTAFDKLREVNPFRAIADPVQWQRELRDEWERPLPGRS